MNDISRSHLDEYGSTNGDVNLVRRLDDVLRIADVGIFDFPPPLVSYHVDPQGPQSSDPRQGPRRRYIHKNENQQYQRGRSSCAPHPSNARPLPLWFLNIGRDERDRACGGASESIHERANYDDVNHRCHDHQKPVEMRDRFCFGSLRIECGLESAASGQHHHCDGGDAARQNLFEPATTRGDHCLTEGGGTKVGVGCPLLRACSDSLNIMWSLRVVRMALPCNPPSART